MLRHMTAPLSGVCLTNQLVRQLDKGVGSKGSAPFLFVGKVLVATRVAWADEMQVRLLLPAPYSGIVQLAERQVLILNVGGSNPSPRAIFRITHMVCGQTVNLCELGSIPRCGAILLHGVGSPKVETFGCGPKCCGFKSHPAPHKMLGQLNWQSNSFVNYRLTVRVRYSAP